MNLHRKLSRAFDDLLLKVGDTVHSFFAEPLNFLFHTFARHDQIEDDALVDVDHALVFGKVMKLMALGEYAPYLRPEFQRMRQHLAHDVAMMGAI